MASKPQNLDRDEVVRLLDAYTRHQDHFNGCKVAAMGASMYHLGYTLLGTSEASCAAVVCCCTVELTITHCNADADLINAKASLLALTPVVLLCACANASDSFGKYQQT